MFVEDLFVFFMADAQFTKNLSEERTLNNNITVIGDNHGNSLVVPKGVVTATTSNPVKTSDLCYFAKITVRY